MATLLNPYLTFAGNAREAMEAYAEMFGSSLEVMTFGQAGASGGEGGPDPEHLMHAHTATPAGTLMASDLPPGAELDRGNGVTLSLSGDDDATLRRWFAALSEGGTVTTPLEKQMWGDVFGMCTDRFGVSWMVNIAG